MEHLQFSGMFSNLRQNIIYKYFDIRHFKIVSGALAYSKLMVNLTNYAKLLYSRLLTAKQVSRTLVRDGSYPWIPNPIAVELGMNDVSWGSTTAVPVNAINEEIDTDHFYRLLLNCIEKLFDGELEQTTFEDFARITFGTEAYQLFTVDKVIGILNKQVNNNHG